MKHTPGPWTARQSWVYAGEQMVGFATELHPEGSSPKTRPTEEANARMFAAAPELLARLKTRRANCTCETDSDGHFLPPGQAVCDECQADAVVLAKAEGRTR